MPVLPDIIETLASTALVAHLTDSSPLQLPINLATLIEASFPGYTPSNVNVYTQGMPLARYALMSGRAEYLNIGPAIPGGPTALYLTTPGPSPLLLAIVGLGSTLLPEIPSGNFFVEFEATGFALPGM